ncbi:hypothetical protein BBJ28_00015430 [Nothophytophthora sp. Chile5]|nr:hypothetical protein BBJ28_00015430 [Nothophytophthora sp. Chile5]
MDNVPLGGDASRPAFTASAAIGSRALASDTVVFSHPKLPTSRRSAVVAGMASSASASAAPLQHPVESAIGRNNAVSEDARPASANGSDGSSFTVSQQPQRRRVESPNGVRRLTIRVKKQGDKLGFGVRHDRHRRLKVSTLQGNDSLLRVGDALLSVNGVNLTGLEFLTVIQLLKSTRPGDLLFEIERTLDAPSPGPGSQKRRDRPTTAATNAPIGMQMEARTQAAAVVGNMGTSVPSPAPLIEAWSAPPAPATTGSLAMAPTLAYYRQNSDEQQEQPGSNGDRNLTGFTSIATVVERGAALPVAVSGGAPNADQPPRKRARPSQRAAVGSSVLDSNGQPINTNALLAELKRERADKAALEDKNTALRKRLQRMLIENDEVRVRASTEVTAAQEKAQREVADAQKALAAARAQMRLQDRGPDVARTDSIISELMACKGQLERLRKVDMDRNAVLTTRYRGECRIAAADAQRVLDTLVGMFRTKLRQVGRLSRDGSSSAEVEVACDGVRRLAFMKLFRLTHDFAYYASATFHALELVRHTVEQEQFTELFGSSLCHEERTGLFFVATAPMSVVFDPSTESVILTCNWAQQNALRDLARNFRF